MSEQEPVTRPTMSEAMESLTGFDVTAIEDHWGIELDKLSGMKLSLGVVAMLNKRGGLSTKDAWQTAKSLTMRELNDHFRTEPDGVSGDLGGSGKA